MKFGWKNYSNARNSVHSLARVHSIVVLSACMHDLEFLMVKNAGQAKQNEKRHEQQRHTQREKFS
jgi:hypothetical protein